MKPTIGWIGLGKMGMPMAGNLLKAGYPLYIYARSEEVMQRMIDRGAKAAAAPCALLANVDVLILMIPDDKAVDDVFISPDGILDGNLQGKIIVNMSTVSAVINRKMAALCMEAGAHYLDAPVSGSVRQAEEAKLVVMVGGESAVYEIMKPVFEKLGSFSKLVGDIGMGNIMKLAINVLLGIQALGLSEVINFAQTYGLPASTVMEIINNGTLGSTFFKIKGEQIITGNFTPAFALSQLTKDLALANKQGWNGPLGNQGFKIYMEALPEFGGEDIIAVQKYLQA